MLDAFLNKLKDQHLTQESRPVRAPSPAITENHIARKALADRLRDRLMAEGRFQGAMREDADYAIHSAPDGFEVLIGRSEATSVALGDTIATMTCAAISTTAMTNLVLAKAFPGADGRRINWGYHTCTDGCETRALWPITDEIGLRIVCTDAQVDALLDGTAQAGVIVTMQVVSRIGLREL